MAKDNAAKLKAAKSDLKDVVKTISTINKEIAHQQARLPRFVTKRANLEAKISELEAAMDDVDL
jgi:septal ring factor EnvC (AmiA/AmiB activator)